jgi:hypothetical protein
MRRESSRLGRAVAISVPRKSNNVGGYESALDTTSGMRRLGSRSDGVTTKWVTVAAVIAALGAPAGAADLLPAIPRHLPHGPQARPPVVSPGHAPGATIGLPNAEPAGSAVVGWGANGTLMATPVAISTNPSGVIGGTQFDPAYQFSPNWLNGTVGGR